MTNPAIPQRLAPEVFAGLLGEYVDTMAPTTEAPAEFHFMAFATVLGLVFADARIKAGTFRIHPTLFTILTGPTGQARKTTVNRAALNLLADLDPEVGIISGEGSRQGMTSALIRAAATEQGQPTAATFRAITERRLVISGPNDIGAVGRPTMVKVHEFTKLLRQAGRAGTADLTELYLELFDRPESIENNSLRSPMTLLDPVVAVLGDSTEEALADVFGEGNISNGFLNRLSIVRGEYLGDPLPRPPAPDADRLARLIEDVHAARAKVPADAVVTFSPMAGEYFDRLYVTTLAPRMRDGLGEVVAREGDQVQRFAMLYALQDGRTVIEAADVGKGWGVASYLSESALSLAGKVGAGDRAKALDYVLGRIASKGLEGVRLSEPEGGRIGVGYLQAMLNASRRASIRAYGLGPLVEQLERDGEVFRMTPAKLLKFGVTAEHEVIVARTVLEDAKAAA